MLVSKCVIVHPPVSPRAGPSNRNLHGPIVAVIPTHRRKPRSCKDMVRRINVKVILFALQIKIWRPCNKRMRSIFNRENIGYGVAGSPLPPNLPLP